MGNFRKLIGIISIIAIIVCRRSVEMSHVSVQ